jgi:uncharacterized protein (TIGR02145 family)
MKTNLFRKNYSSSKWGMRIMRLALLLLPLLGRGLGGSCVLFAQNGVAVSGLAVNAGTVTFNVSWKNTGMPALWSDTVWVFVDYNNAGKMERLPLLPGATLTTTSPGGKVIEAPDNNKGVWVAGNARSAGSFSATVKLLTAVKNVGGACVYGSNYPPVGEYIAAQTIQFTGTPPYDLVLSSGATVTACGDYNLLSGQTLDTFTDATGAPGIIKEIVTPPLAASTKTWVIVGNGITQTWSDNINVPACNISSFSNSSTVPQCRSATYNSVLNFYYNWSYVNANKNTMCPSPWRVPTANDLMILDLALGGDGQNRQTDKSWINQKYNIEWGNYHVGAIIPNSVVGLGRQHMWSADACEGNARYMYYGVAEGIVNTHICITRTEGHGVRCVR